MSDWPLHFQYGLLLLAGIAVSFINAISGGGSILSLPLLMLLGLPAAEANGTNRLGIWAGSLGSILGFRKRGIVTKAMLWKVAWPGLIGSMAGSLLGVSIPEPIFKTILAAVILFVVLETVRAKRGALALGNEERSQVRTGFIPFVVYLGIGFYGGFIQAGSGLIMIYAFSRITSFNLIQINDLKVHNTFLFISLSLGIFLCFGKVNFGLALSLALGNLVGGYLGSLIQIHRGEGFVRGFLVVSGIGFAVKLALDAIFAFF